MGEWRRIKRLTTFHKAVSNSIPFAIPDYITPSIRQDTRSLSRTYIEVQVNYMYQQYKNSFLPRRKIKLLLETGMPFHLTWYWSPLKTSPCPIHREVQLSGHLRTKFKISTHRRNAQMMSEARIKQTIETIQGHGTRLYPSIHS